MHTFLPLLQFFLYLKQKLMSAWAEDGWRWTKGLSFHGCLCHVINLFSLLSQCLFIWYTGVSDLIWHVKYWEFGLGSKILASVSCFLEITGRILLLFSLNVTQWCQMPYCPLQTNWFLPPCCLCPRDWPVWPGSFVLVFLLGWVNGWLHLEWREVRGTFSECSSMSFSLRPLFPSGWPLLHDSLTFWVLMAASFLPQPQGLGMGTALLLLPWVTARSSDSLNLDLTFVSSPFINKGILFLVVFWLLKC
jgi:hypothetical protein